MSNGPRFTLKGDRIQLSENDVKRACLDVLGLRHWLPIRQHVGLFQTVAANPRVLTIGTIGDPDFVVVKPPSFFLETKRPGGRLRNEQRTRIDQLKQFYDLDTAVVESVDELVEWLERREQILTRR